MGCASVPDGVPAEIDRRLALRETGMMNPFAVRRLGTGEVVGMTTFCNIDQPNRRVEIGCTWLDTSAHGTTPDRPATRRTRSRHRCACGGGRSDRHQQ